MAIVLTKRDLVDADQLTWFSDQAGLLAEFASTKGVVASIMTVAARPAATPDSPEGLDELLRWLTEQSTLAVEEPASSILPSDRQFWRYSIAH